MKSIINILYIFIILLLVITAGVVAASILDIPGGYKLYTVQSGSMEPAIKTGSIVAVKAVDVYSAGDVITFTMDSDPNLDNPASTTTHRVFEIIREDGEMMFRTKGDANDAPDGELISADRIVGKVLFSVPLLGYPVVFARTQLGLIALIIIPSTLIVYSEIISIRNELKKIIERRRKKKESILETAI